jgi:dTDP-4-dehydrorhamnose 3,5-epimerase
MKSPTIIEVSHIKDALIIELDTFYDFRGHNFAGYDKEVYAKLHPFFAINTFSIDSFSSSTKGVLRGFHGDTKTHKLIQVLQGRIQMAVVDMRAGSPTQSAVLELVLDAKRPTQILVPAGCVNAHLCLSETCLFSYKMSHPYVKQEDQIFVPWNSQNVQWQETIPILSQRDGGCL